MGLTGKVFFTSDWHLDHANIIKYSNRPFTSVGEMNQTIIDNVNVKVGPDDTLYFLGDFCFNIKRYEEFRRAIQCKNLHLIYGNHDRAIQLNTYLQGLFSSCQHMLQIQFNNKSIVLCHYALRTWNKSHRGTWSLYGHSHGSLPDDPNLLSFDVGVDCHNFQPLSFDDVRKIMSRKGQSIDGLS